MACPAPGAASAAGRGGRGIAGRDGSVVTAGFLGRAAARPRGGRTEAASREARRDGGERRGENDGEGAGARSTASRSRSAPKRRRKRASARGRRGRRQSVTAGFSGRSATKRSHSSAAKVSRSGAGRTAGKPEGSGRVRPLRGVVRHRHAAEEAGAAGSRDCEAASRPAVDRQRRGPTLEQREGPAPERGGPRGSRKERGVFDHFEESFDTGHPAEEAAAGSRDCEAASRPAVDRQRRGPTFEQREGPAPERGGPRGSREERGVFDHFEESFDTAPAAEGHRQRGRRRGDGASRPASSGGRQDRGGRRLRPEGGRGREGRPAAAEGSRR